MFVIFLVSVLFLNRTRIGRHIYAVGGNDTAARFGISTAKVKFVVFSFSGLMAGLAGITIASRLYSGTCTSGDGAEMETPSPPWWWAALPWLAVPGVRWDSDRRADHRHPEQWSEPFGHQLRLAVHHQGPGHPPGRVCGLPPEHKEEIRRGFIKNRATARRGGSVFS